MAVRAKFVLSRMTQMQIFMKCSNGDRASVPKTRLAVFVCLVYQSEGERRW